MDSILDTIKQALGIDTEYLAYDAIIIAKINLVLIALNQIGVGTVGVFAITGYTEIWNDFLGDALNAEAIKTYISAQVRALFDPLKTEPTSENPDSIFNTVKKILGVDMNDDAFNTDILIAINTTFMVLNQIGVGPVTGFSIISTVETWSDFLGAAINLAAVKSYIYLKVRILFDPPTSSFVLDAMTRQITELEWRLSTQAEQGLYIPVVIGDEENV